MPPSAMATMSSWRPCVVRVAWPSAETYTQTASRQHTLAHCRHVLPRRTHRHRAAKRWSREHPCRQQEQRQPDQSGGALWTDLITAGYGQRADNCHERRKHHRDLGVVNNGNAHDGPVAMERPGRPVERCQLQRRRHRRRRLGQPQWPAGGRGQATPAKRRPSRCEDISGDYYVIVDTSTIRQVIELGHTANNSRAHVVPLTISLAAGGRSSGQWRDRARWRSPGRRGDGKPTQWSTKVAPPRGAAWPRPHLHRSRRPGPVGSCQPAQLPGAGLGAGAQREPFGVSFVPAQRNAGRRFPLVVRTDADNTIYERTGENKQRRRCPRPASPCSVPIWP